MNSANMRNKSHVRCERLGALLTTIFSLLGVAFHVAQQVTLRHKLFQAQLALKALLLMIVDLMHLLLLPGQTLVAADLARERRQAVLGAQVGAHKLGRADVHFAEFTVELRITMIVCVLAQRIPVREYLLACWTFQVLLLEVGTLVNPEVVDICVGFAARVTNILLCLLCMIDVIMPFQVSLQEESFGASVTSKWLLSGMTAHMQHKWPLFLVSFST